MKTLFHKINVTDIGNLFNTENYQRTVWNRGFVRCIHAVNRRENTGLYGLPCVQWPRTVAKTEIAPNRTVGFIASPKHTVRFLISWDPHVTAPRKTGKHRTAQRQLFFYWKSHEPHWLWEILFTENRTVRCPYCYDRNEPHRRFFKLEKLTVHEDE